MSITLYFLPLLNALFASLCVILFYFCSKRKIESRIKEEIASFEAKIHTKLESIDLQKETAPLLEDKLNHLILNLKQDIPLLSLLLSGTVVQRFKNQAKGEFLKMMPALKQKLLTHFSAEFDMEGLVFEKMDALFWKRQFIKATALAFGIGFFIGLLILLILHPMKKQPPVPEIILEKDKRLSKSILWDLQSAAYCQFGPQAWAGKGVPFYPTSNPFIARQYAQVAAGFVRDCLHPRSPTPMDPSKTTYILDLGAGTGRFGYLFLKNFMTILSTLRLDTFNFCYVMTDIADSTLEFLRTHPYLQLFIKTGKLDFAKYHHAQTKPLELLVSGKILIDKEVINPLIVIGNYFFDTIPQDLFKAKEGKLLEGRVTLTVADTEQTRKIASGDPAIINHLKTHFSYSPIDHVDSYYADDPLLNDILKSYGDLFEDTPILFPEGAFKTLDYFRKLSGDRFLLLAGDQGRCTEKQLQHLKSPYIAKHGSFSIPVNYHAIAKYFRSLGGMSLLTTHPQPIFVVTASAFGGKASDYVETAFAFKNYVDFFEPNEYFLLLEYTEKEWVTPNLDTILLLIKLGNWDPINCHMFIDRILKDLPEATESTREKLGVTLHRLWDNFFPVTKEEACFVMNLGVIFFGMERYEEALLYFERAALLKEDEPLIFQNMAVCYERLGRTKGHKGP